MTEFTFRADNRTARRVRAIVPKLIAGASDALDVQAIVDAQYSVVFPVLAGWWMFANRTAEAMMLLYERGFSVEAVPLMRNLIGHAYAMHWLADNGEPAYNAFIDESWQSRKKLNDNLTEAKWHLAGIDIGEKPVFTFATAEEEKQHRRLVGELSKFVNLVNAYGEPMMYPLYRNLSAYTHTTDLTSLAYVKLADDGSLTVSDQPLVDRLSDLCWMVIPLLQAASVMSPMIKGNPMKKLVTEAVRDLGLPADLLPKRR
ncbi:DUF5677 domain-containing protein [Streptomyces sp. NPDC088197]|uniref:DUF5677 domain-containing protein n=1 Tax=Streptomyces sp. NPDC088197 TaxID=3365840 RepID=UPI00382A5F34